MFKISTMKTLYTALTLLFFAAAFAQVGVNTTSPSAVFEVKASSESSPSNTDGFLTPRIDAFPAINPTAAQQGMMVYLTTASGSNLPGFYYWDNLTNSWIGFLSSGKGDKDWYKVGTTSSPTAITDDVYRTGKVGIGVSAPTVPLQFGWTTGDKISFFGDAAAHHGIGIQDYLMQIHGGIAADDIAFGYGSSAAFTERMRIKGTGNVGIGTSAPASKVHIFNGSSTITPNGSSLLTVEGSGTNVYTNLLSTQETGVLFGASGSSANGGVIYNSAAVPNGMTFRTGGNANRMIISSTGNVGIGNFVPTNPLEFDNVVGNKICLWGNATTGYGLGIQASLLQMYTQSALTDIAFGYGVSDTFTDLLRIKGNGRVGIGTSAPASKVHIFNGSSTITPNGSSLLTVEGSGTNVYTNILSTQETGVLFGASGASANGGVIYNPVAYPNSMAFRTGGNTNRMVIGSTGNVAIGNFNPDFPLQFSGNLGDKISLYGSAGPHFGFGIQNSLLQIHSSIASDDIAFGYGTSSAFTELMRIKGNGNVGIGTNPVFPLHFSDGYGDKISLWGSTVSNHYGFGIQNKLLVIHSDYDFSDIAFGYGNATSFNEKMRIKGTGEVGIGTSTPTAELEVNGFTKMGSTAPAVKMIKLTGTTASTQGTQTAIPHGLTSSKILSVNVLVDYAAGASVPPSYNGSAGYEYDYFITTTSITVWPKSGNSINILSKAIRILVTYEE